MSDDSASAILQPLQQHIDTLQASINELEHKVHRLTCRRPNYHVVRLADWRHGIDPLNPSIVDEYMSLFPKGVTLSFGGVRDEHDGRLFLADLEDFVPLTGVAVADNHSRAVLLSNSIRGEVLNAWADAYKHKWFGMLDWRRMSEWFLAKYQVTMDPTDHRQLAVGRLMHMNRGTGDNVRLAGLILEDTYRLEGPLTKQELVIMRRLVGPPVVVQSTWQDMNEALRSYAKQCGERQLLDSRIKKEER